MLDPHECRVLGVLIEKAFTTPAQYPLSLNAVTTGCNQKSNRAPVMRLSEEEVLEALDRLRGKELVREVMMSGSRVSKYRHHARDVLPEVDKSEVVILAELMLRGPQTVGEIRGRASRMQPLESTEVVEARLDHLMNRDQPLVQRLRPAPGSRAARYAQLLCPTAHPLDAPAAAVAPATTPTSATPQPSAELLDRVERLEREVAALRKEVNSLRVGVRMS